MIDQRRSDGTPEDDMAQSVQGLVPYVSDFIVHTWNWRPWLTEHPARRLRDEGPVAHPPGHHSPNSGWTIAFEGAYPWAIDFTYASNEVGRLKQYLDDHGLTIECEAGYAISVQRRDD